MLILDLNTRLYYTTLMPHNQDYLNFYFANVWKPGYNPDGKTCNQILAKIKPDDWVLDVGCGNNPFAGKIKTLVGIDPANDNAHIKCTIEDFASDIVKFDVALCLGSINFGDDAVIERQIAKVITHLKPTAKIFWRCNPGQRDHGNKDCEQIDFYPWSFEKQIMYADRFGFKILELSWDDRRIYAEWQRIA
jgi:hypothetical protein